MLLSILGGPSRVPPGRLSRCKISKSSSFLHRKVNYRPSVEEGQSYPTPLHITYHLPTRSSVQSDLQNINCEFFYRKKWPASIWMDELRIIKRLGPDNANKVCLDFRGK